MNEQHKKDEKRPLFGAWWKFYTAVVVWLIALIVFFYFFTGMYS